MIIAILVYLGIGFFGSAIKERFFPERFLGVYVIKDGVDVLIYTLCWPFVIIVKCIMFIWDFISGNI